MPIYSYAELKGKIKVGDRVRAVNGKPNACAELGDVMTLPNGSEKVCTITDVAEDRFWINNCGHGYLEDHVLELLTEEKTLDTVDVGDVVVDKRDFECTILDTSKNGTILFTSRFSNSAQVGGYYTRQEMRDQGYTVKQSTPAPEPKEMTLDEVSKALGYPVRIKE